MFSRVTALQCYGCKRRLHIDLNLVQQIYPCFYWTYGLPPFRAAHQNQYEPSSGMAKYHTLKLAEATWKEARERPG